MRRGLPLAILVILVLALVQPSHTATTPTPYTAAAQDPAPVQPVGYYDFFGSLLTPEQARQMVVDNGLNPFFPDSFRKLGLVRITPELIASGRSIFLNHKIGDTFGLQRLFGFGAGFVRILPEMIQAIVNLNGSPTTNLRIVLLRDLTLGSRTFPRGTTLSTGLDVEAGGVLPIGLRADGNVTCAACHVTLDSEGRALVGAPNSDVNAALLIALAPNTASAFARVNLNPLDPAYGQGKQIIDSNGQLVTLPDPAKFERAFDDAVMDVPAGHFESSPDGINNTTKIPTVFTFRTGPYLMDGMFGVGPFAGLSAITNAVHSSEVNLLAAVQLSQQTLGMDPEVYLGVALQNAADPSIRLPDGAPVRPSEWLRHVAPDALKAELEDQVSAPGTGTYPNLKPSLFTLNGLVFSPNTLKLDPAQGPFLFGANSMAAFQNSLLPPPNRSEANRQALASGSVGRGAVVFQDAGCASCHAGAFYTDNRIHPIGEIRSNPARARSHLALNGLLVPPEIFSLDTTVPAPPGARVLAVPTAGFSPTPTSLPTGLLPDGGYKTTALRGVYLSAPYLHDGGVAVRAGSLRFNLDGSFVVVDPQGLGLTGTLVIGVNADAASSLRALVDRQLRQQVVAANLNSPALVRSNLDGTGHDFYVDPTGGFTYAQQADLVNFLLSLDDDSARY
jgi:mono/diheme cytochrome c family protein